MSTIDLTVSSTIDEVPAAEWDAIAGGNVLASYGWLKTVEMTLRVPLQPYYLAAREAGTVVAGAVACAYPPGVALETLDHLFLGRARALFARLGISFLPAMVCCPLHSFGAHLLTSPAVGPEHRRSLKAILVDGLEEAAARHQMTPAWVHVLEGEPEVGEMLTARGYLRARGVPLNMLDIRWDSFDGYLTSLSSISRDARKDVRRHINQNRERGTVIRRLDDPRPHQERLYELLDRNSLRHNGWPFPYRPAFFSTLKANLGNEASIYASFKGETITGVSLLLARGGVGYLPMVGIDHEVAGRDFTYFNVAQYRPIADAIDTGLRQLCFGRALYELKARRGCQLFDLDSFFKPRRRISALWLRPWFKALSEWNRLKLPSRVRRAPRR